MKKSFVVVFIFILAACSVSAPIQSDSNSLYEVVTQQEDGGANIRFYEILSEEKEIAMLKNDENLKNKIAPTDIKSSNFIIANLGQKSSAGYKIEIEKIEETAKNIIITIKEIAPKTNLTILQETVNPYAVIKINSKKEIIIQ